MISHHIFQAIITLERVRIIITVHRHLIIRLHRHLPVRPTTNSYFPLLFSAQAFPAVQPFP
jgi:hypothetical protein